LIRNYPKYCSYIDIDTFGYLLIILMNIQRSRFEYSGVIIGYQLNINVYIYFYVILEKTVSQKYLKIQLDTNLKTILSGHQSN